MKSLIKNPLEVKATDSLGTTVLKGMTVGYFKGVLAAGAGLGVLGLIGWTISKRVDSEREEEIYEEILEEEDILDDESEEDKIK